MSSMKKIARASGVAAALALASAAASAVVPVQLYGGGATLPTNAYVGNEWLSFNPAHRLSNTDPASPNTAGTGSLFALQASNAFTPAYVQYCQTGSGTGRGVITGAKPDATSACGDYSMGTPNGFSAATADAHFSGSDAPFSASDVATFLTNKGAAHGSPVQFPAVVGAIAVVYNNADLGATQLNLTESMLCRIFSGRVTSWDKVNSTLPAKPIKLVVRSDNSGTTFSFMNHLSAVCPTANPTAVSGFTTQSVFKDGFPGGATMLPASAIQSSGNGGVIASIVATDGAIGYAEASDTKARKDLAGASGINWATISKRPNIKATGTSPAVYFKKFDPFLNSLAKRTVNPVSDKVLGPNDANGRPTVVSVTPGVPEAAGCIQLVDPNTYAVPFLNSKGDYYNYPIVAVSYLMGYYQGNEAGKKLTALKNLLASPYTPVSTVTTIGTGTGFSWVNAPVLDATAMARISPTASIPMKALVMTCIK